VAFKKINNWKRRVEILEEEVKRLDSEIIKLEQNNPSIVVPDTFTGNIITNMVTPSESEFSSFWNKTDSFVRLLEKDLLSNLGNGTIYWTEPSDATASTLHLINKSDEIIENTVSFEDTYFNIE